MAGFLEKNKRLIDYKLTELGRDKLSTGSLDLVYYTFSDSSIIYRENEKTEKNFKVSDITKYLPFEVDVNINNIINPEYNLSSVLSFDSLDNNILFVNKEANKTISDFLIDLKYLDNKVLIGKNDDRTISFDYELNPERSEFDFLQKSASYVTIKSEIESLRNIEYVSKDRRFLQKTRNKFLPPKNSFKEIDELDENPMDSNQLGVLFKSFKTSQKIPDFTNRQDFIVKMTKLLRQSQNIYKLDYVLNEEKSNEEDIFLFEIHKIIDNLNIVGEEDTLQKISFIDLGEFYDKEELNFKRIFLAGKFFLTRNIKNEISIENKRKKFQINNDYSFINMFTLVVE